MKRKQTLTFTIIRRLVCLAGGRGCGFDLAPLLRLQRRRGAKSISPLAALIAASILRPASICQPASQPAGAAASREPLLRIGAVNG